MEELRQKLAQIMESVESFLEQHQELEDNSEVAAFDAHIVSIFPLTRGGLQEHHVAEAQRLKDRVLALM